MNENIKLGDTVRLKSGGPIMTVDWIENEYGVLKAGCTWFEKDKKNSSAFPVHTLELSN